jgi:hypothetical protein
MCVQVRPRGEIARDNLEAHQGDLEAVAGAADVGDRSLREEPATTWVAHEGHAAPRPRKRADLLLLQRGGCVSGDLADVLVGCQRDTQACASPRPSRAHLECDIWRRVLKGSGCVLAKLQVTL